MRYRVTVGPYLEKHMIEIKSGAQAEREAAFIYLQSSVGNAGNFKAGCDRLANALANEEKIKIFFNVLRKQYNVFDELE